MDCQVLAIIKCDSSQFIQISYFRTKSHSSKTTLIICKLKEEMEMIKGTAVVQYIHSENW